MVEFDLAEFALRTKLGSLQGGVAETLRLDKDVTLLVEDESKAAVRLTVVAVSLILLTQDRPLARCTDGRIAAPSRMIYERSRPVQS